MTGTGRLVVAREDPRRDDVRSLLAVHLAFAAEHSPPEDVHALDVDDLVGPGLAFFAGRVDGELVTVGALRRIDDQHAEIKSMHTAAAARGQGHGRAMLDHLLQVARDEGYRRVSLETGTMAAFEAARRLYASAGFTVCPPFADYPNSRNSTWMTLPLDHLADHVPDPADRPRHRGGVDLHRADHLADPLGRAAGLPGELLHLAGDDGEPEAGRS